MIACDDATPDPDLLRVARVGVGALGIVTKVTIQCVPAFNLHARETIEVLDDVLDDFDNFTTQSPSTSSSTGCPEPGAAR